MMSRRGGVADTFRRQHVVTCEAQKDAGSRSRSRANSVVRLLSRVCSQYQTRGNPAMLLCDAADGQYKQRA
jgi:hypothetical protein